MHARRLGGLGPRLRRQTWLLLLLLSPAVPCLADDEKPRVEPKDAAGWAAELKVGDVERRRKAAYALWKLGADAKGVLPALAAALRDDDAYVRATADSVLANFGMAKAGGALWPAVPELVTGITDARVAVRRLAVGILWRAGWPSGEPPGTLVPALIKALDDEDVTVRAQAAAVVANFGGWAKDAAPALVRRAKDPDKDVRLWSVQALGALGGPNFMDVLLAALSDEDPKVRAAAAGGFGFPSPKVRAAVPALVKALDDPEAMVREAAVGAFVGMSGAVPAAEAVPRLIAYLEAEQPNMRANAAAALGQVGDPRALEPLTHRASDDVDSSVRTQAVMALGALGPEGAESLDVLVSALADADVWVASSAAGALARLGPLAAEAEDALRRAVRHPDSNVRHASLYALSQIGTLSAETRATFVAALDDPAAAVRGQATVFLGDLGADAAPMVPALLRLLARPDGKEQRYGVVVTLARIGPAAREAAEAVRALQPEGIDVAARANALARIAATPEDVVEGVRILVRLLESEAKEDALAASVVPTFLADLGEAARPARAALAVRFVMAEGIGWLSPAEALVAIDGAKAVAAAERIRASARAGDAWALVALAKRLLSDPATPSILLDGLAAEFPLARADAIEGLARLPSSSVTEDVVSRIRAARADPSSRVRMAAALALRRLGKEAR